MWIVAALAALWLAAAGCVPGSSEDRPSGQTETGGPASGTPEGNAGTGEPTMMTASPGLVTSPASGAPGGSAPECVGGAISDPAFDVTDERLLVGFAENVFLGRVAEELGSEGRAEDAPGPYDPLTQFSVEVVENVKGGLGGTVTVIQRGAYLPERGCVALVNSDPLLEPGREYVFLTSGDVRDGPHQVVAPVYGKVPVKDAANRGALVRRYERAAEDQRDPFSDR